MNHFWYYHHSAIFSRGECNFQWRQSSWDSLWSQSQDLSTSSLLTNFARQFVSATGEFGFFNNRLNPYSSMIVSSSWNNIHFRPFEVKVNSKRCRIKKFYYLLLEWRAFKRAFSWPPILEQNSLIYLYPENVFSLRFSSVSI